MTKAEVLENIKYNENLVYQYQKKINDLQQQISSQNAAVNKLNAQLREMSSQKKQLDSQTDELDRLKKKFDNLQRDFAGKQSKRINNFNKNFSQNLNTHFIGSYISGMQNLLSGAEYKKAYNGLSDAGETVLRKLKAKRNESQAVGARITAANKDIDARTRMISSLKGQLNQTNSDLAYRKQRITYWKDQLKNAT